MKDRKTEGLRGKRSVINTRYEPHLKMISPWQGSSKKSQEFPGPNSKIITNKNKQVINNNAVLAADANDAINPTTVRASRRSSRSRSSLPDSTSDESILKTGTREIQYYSFMYSKLYFSSFSKAG